MDPRIRKRNKNLELMRCRSCWKLLVYAVIRTHLLVNKANNYHQNKFFDFFFYKMDIFFTQNEYKYNQKSQLKKYF